jgi:hypothetical protein
LKTISDIEDRIQQNDIKKNLLALETKMNLRQDDIVRVLTKRLADRDEVNKSLRIVKNYSKLVFDLLKITLISEERKQSNSIFRELRNTIQSLLSEDENLPDLMQKVKEFCVHNSILQHKLRDTSNSLSPPKGGSRNPGFNSHQRIQQFRARNFLKNMTLCDSNQFNSFSMANGGDSLIINTPQTCVPLRNTFALGNQQISGKALGTLSEKVIE